MDLLNIGAVEFGSCELSYKINSHLFFGQLCDKKTCAFVVMRIGKKVVWAGGRMGRGHEADSVLFVGVCVCGTKVGLGGHNQASNIVLAAK